MSIDKELIENKLNNMEKEKIVEEAKNKAMSKERRAITELFKKIQFEVEYVSNMKK